MSYPQKDGAGNPILTRDAQITKVGGTAQTGRDLSLDLKVLTDLKKGAQNADGLSAETANVLKMLASPLDFNGSTFDRRRNNLDVTLLSSSARTSGLDSPVQTNYSARGAIVILDITVVPGTDTVQLQIKGAHNGVDVILAQDAAQVGTGKRVVLVYPGAGAAADDVNLVRGYPLPRAWYAHMIHSGSGSFTYSVRAAYIL